MIIGSNSFVTNLLTTLNDQRPPHGMVHRRVTMHSSHQTNADPVRWWGDGAKNGHRHIIDHPRQLEIASCGVVASLMSKPSSRQRNSDAHFELQAMRGHTQCCATLGL
jgi:hypothetical protein